MRLKRFVVISHMELVIGSYMNLFVITNVYSRRLIYSSSLHKIHQIVYSEVNAMKYLHIDLDAMDTSSLYLVFQKQYTSIIKALLRGTLLLF